MQTVLYQNGIRFVEKKFKLEKNFERLLIQNGKALFGKHSILVDVKKKISTQHMGGTIPDCFLIELSDPENPEFYIVEVELAKHSFFNHIFPQITKFFAFFKNQDSQSQLVENLYEIFDKDESLKKALKSRIGRKETFKYLKDMIENSQNILLILDSEKNELPEIIETYTDTWGKIVKVAIFKEYTNGSDSILSLSPDFENIETIDIVSPPETKEKRATTYTESYHLDGIPENISSVYQKMKEELILKIPDLKINPQRYYISLRKKRNFAFIKIRKKKVAIVAMAAPERIKASVPNYNIVDLSDSVQNFYNGPCARIDINNSKHLDEVIQLLIEIQK